MFTASDTVCLLLQNNRYRLSLTWAQPDVGSVRGPCGCYSQLEAKDYAKLTSLIKMQSIEMKIIISNVMKNYSLKLKSWLCDYQ